MTVVVQQAAAGKGAKIARNTAFETALGIAGGLEKGLGVCSEVLGFANETVRDLI